MEVLAQAYQTHKYIYKPNQHKTVITYIISCLSRAALAPSTMSAAVLSLGAVTQLKAKNHDDRPYVLQVRMPNHTPGCGTCSVPFRAPISGNSLDYRSPTYRREQTASTRAAYQMVQHLSAPGSRHS